MLASVYNQGQRTGTTVAGANKLRNNDKYDNCSNSNTNNNNNNNNDNNLNSSIYQSNAMGSRSKQATKLTEAIVDFNESELDPGVNDTFQIKLLQLMLVMIMLEDQIEMVNGRIDASQPTVPDNAKVHLTVRH